MEDGLNAYAIAEDATVLDALKKIDVNRQGFVVVVDRLRHVLGVLTDGDIRRALIGGCNQSSPVSACYTSHAKTVRNTDSFHAVTELFKNPAIKFLPILDGDGRFVNLITKSQFHTLLLQDIRADLSYDFSSLDTGLIDYEIFQKPWGFYKTTVLNNFYQSKVISVRPGEKLSLQSHFHREEHWIVVHGVGVVQLEQSFMPVTCGMSVFIPKGCKHRLSNTDERENLIIAEVQIGDYLGEDDIVRYEDVYGRTEEKDK